MGGGTGTGSSVVDDLNYREIHPQGVWEHELEEDYSEWAEELTRDISDELPDMYFVRKNSRRVDIKSLPSVATETLDSILDREIFSYRDCAKINLEESGDTVEAAVSYGKDMPIDNKRSIEKVVNSHMEKTPGVRRPGF